MKLKVLRFICRSLMAGAVSLTVPVAALAEDAPAATERSGMSSRELERELQQLNWKQFEAVVKGVPKLRAQVDAYGPLGWQYVREHYQTYGWRRSIDKLDEQQKLDLKALIARTRGRSAH